MFTRRPHDSYFYRGSERKAALLREKEAGGKEKRELVLEFARLRRRVHVTDYYERPRLDPTGSASRGNYRNTFLGARLV